MMKKDKVILIKFIMLNLIIILSLSSVYAENADDLYRNGKYAEAEKAYRQGDLDNPKDLRWRYNKGCAAFQNKNYQEAESAFTSVLRRSKDSNMLSYAAYNLGNTAFAQDDFAAAADYYKQAIIYNPDNANAKYNLELSVKKLEEAKKNPDKNKNNKNDKKDNQQKGDQKSQKGDKKNQDRKESGKQDKSKDKQGQDPKDMSGDLNSANQMGDKPRVQLSPAQMLEQKKAEALLDNIKENRAKIIQYQAPEGKKRADSGKNW